MQEIIKKANDLVIALEAEIVEVNNAEKELNDLISKQKVLFQKNKDFEIELIDRERKVSYVSDIVKVSEESKLRFNEASDIKKENVEKSKELDKKSNELLAKEKELKDLLALYRAKNESINKEKVQIEKDRKEMRIKIIDELKGLK